MCSNELHGFCRLKTTLMNETKAIEESTILCGYSFDIVFVRL
jgi:hypothetical protein